MDDNNMLRIDVHDAVGTKEALNQPDPAPSMLSRLVLPHKKVSREVTEEDLPRVLSEADVLFHLCFTPHGIYRSAHAMAHPQIDDKDPLRFFVTVIGEVIINPRVIRHSGFAGDNNEACMSFPENGEIAVPRHNVIDLEFQTVTNEKKLSERMTKTFSGKIAKIIAHEIGHLNGYYIYDEDFDARKSLLSPRGGVGGGLDKEVGAA